MPASLAILSVHLRVADLARSLEFYHRGLGFAVLYQEATRAEFAADPAGPALLTLTEDRTASAPSHHTAGLFHAALLLPSRAALGHWLRRAADAGVEFDGFSDHGVSEAVYLTDVDGNGLEFYADRPASAWPVRDGAIAMFTHPLDLPSVLQAAAAAVPVPAAPLAGARWGHLHLRVTDPDRSVDYYRELLGVDLIQRFGADARFVSRDGYHHHFGLNRWGGISAPQPAHALGLVDATVAAAHLSAPTVARDPDGLVLNLVPLA